MSDEIMTAGEMTAEQAEDFAYRFYELWAKGAGLDMCDVRDDESEDGGEASPDPWGWPGDVHPETVLGTRSESPKTWAERYWQEHGAHILELFREGLEAKAEREREEEEERRKQAVFDQEYERMREQGELEEPAIEEIEYDDDDDDIDEIREGWGE